jgi:hypothetical protein
MSSLLKPIVPPPIEPYNQRWRGPDTRANWARLHEAQAAAVAATPQEIVRDEPDIFEKCALLEARNRELEEQVRFLTEELATKSAPHLRARETR